LRLNWGDADVYGDEIQAAVRFVKADGDVIFGHPVTMRVPPLINERPPNISEPQANTLLGRRS
ncbi:MAG: hypothetical protein V3T70_07975, partial [Phycisphaerae bacterium]